MSGIINLDLQAVLGKLNDGAINRDQMRVELFDKLEFRSSAYFTDENGWINGDIHEVVKAFFISDLNAIAGPGLEPGNPVVK